MTQITEPERWEQMPRLLSRIENPYYRGLYSLIYLTGCRVGEVYREEKGEPIGIRGKDVYYERVGGKNFIFIDLHTEKNRKEKIRTVPIPMDQEPELIKNLYGIVGILDEDNYNHLFAPQTDIKYKSLHKKWWIASKKHLPDRPHWLRHCRATHIIKNYKMRNFENIRKLFGWTDYRPMATYMHLMAEDIALEMLENERV